MERLPDLAGLTHAEKDEVIQYGEFAAVVDIRTLELIDGKLPRRAMELVLDWAELHQTELLEDWRLCEVHMPPRQIEPLQ